MFGGLNPKKMQAMMKQMGIAQEEISASKVIIEKKDRTKLTIDEPSVIKIKMQGQTSFQITGEETEELEEIGISEDDINTVVAKTGCTKETAKKSLEKTGDLAESIMELSE